MQRFLDADAAAAMLRWENSGFSVDASVRITLINRDVPSYFQSLERLLRYCARPPFALERLSVIRGEGGGVSTNGLHSARSAPDVAPRDPPRSADPCRRVIGRPILLSLAAPHSGGGRRSATSRSLPEKSS
jgi:hypothetical protein